MNVEISGVAKKKSFYEDIKERFFNALRLTDEPVIKLYTGYGNRTHCFIFGHTLSFGPLPRKKYRDYFWLNTLAVLRLFMVKPMRGALVQFTWKGRIYTTRSEKDGFFKFEWEPGEQLAAGDHIVEVLLIHPFNKSTITSAKAKVIIPHLNQYAFISDIDDTFLISHSSNLRKRLFVLLTENARSRDPFEGVVNHYQLLSLAGAPENTHNPFFFVSSSEWNLYDYIKEFSGNNKLPDGVYLLNQLKLFSQVFKTGQNNHKTKFMRIARILEAYPEQRFILLGDDSQEDPFIYASIVDHFKHQMVCIYIRRVSKKEKPEVEAKLKAIEAEGVPICYFTHSSEAVIHSQQIGLISAP
ncbi:MAG: phosphatase domain-containing protein [Ferruginibacter sp.]